MNTVMLAAGGETVEVAKTAVDAVITAMSDVFTLSGGKSGACRHRHFPFSDERCTRLM